jgi:hypothetical protein
MSVSKYYEYFYLLCFFIKALVVVLPLHTVVTKMNAFKMIVCISMTVLKSDVPGFICDRYNGHVYLKSASRIGNKQKQTPRHHCKNLFTATQRRCRKQRRQRCTDEKQRKSCGKRQLWYTFRLKFVNKSQNK